jgi:small subunit ribosomal protein S4
MARDLKPKWKKCRRERYSLYDNDKWKKRSTMPGEHGVTFGRLSSYGLRFREKQKVKRIYGMLERQFSKFFRLAEKSKEDSGKRFLKLLEMRLDNVVYRLGLAPTRSSARQIVTHGHIKVNDKKVNIPSYIVKIGDEIRLKESITKKDFVKINLEYSKRIKTPRWLSRLQNGGKVIMEPAREMIDRGINEQLIVEFYSR